MRLKRFVVSGELLASRLGIGDDVTIVGARQGVRVGEVEFIVEGSQFDDVPPGDLIPIAVPMITLTRKPCGCEELTCEWTE